MHGFSKRKKNNFKFIFLSQTFLYSEIEPFGSQLTKSYQPKRCSNFNQVISELVPNTFPENTHPDISNDIIPPVTDIL